jgi:hypothetical protein
VRGLAPIGGAHLSGTEGARARARGRCWAWWSDWAEFAFPFSREFLIAFIFIFSRVFVTPMVFIFRSTTSMDLST